MDGGALFFWDGLSVVSVGGFVLEGGTHSLQLGISVKNAVDPDMIPSPPSSLLKEDSSWKFANGFVVVLPGNKLPWTPCCSCCETTHNSNHRNGKFDFALTMTNDMACSRVATVDATNRIVFDDFNSIDVAPITFFDFIQISFQKRGSRNPAISFHTLCIYVQWHQTTNKHGLWSLSFWNVHC
jgi:hypothetical protein